MGLHIPIPVGTIAELLGHSAAYVTERYAYLQPDNLRAAVALLSKEEPDPNLTRTDLASSVEPLSTPRVGRNSLAAKRSARRVGGGGRI